MARRFPWKAVAAGGAALGVLGVVVIAGRRGSAPLGRVALIGDSYAAGLGPELKKLLPDFRSESQTGISTLGWLSCTTCGAWLPSFAPNVVLVSLGVNDGRSPNLSAAQSIVQRLHGIGARVVWIEPPAGVQTAARGMIAALGVQTIPATTTPLAGDGLHPRSYAGWADEIARRL